MKKCYSCDIELTAGAMLMAGRPFCCAGCAAGGPCSCTYEDQQAQRPSNGHGDPVMTRELFGLMGNEGGRP